MEFKSLIISIVGFRNFFCCLVWAVDLGVQIFDEWRSLYIGSFCPAMISLRRLIFKSINVLFRISFVALSALLILKLKSLMRGEVCTLGHFVLR